MTGRFVRAVLTVLVAVMAVAAAARPLSIAECDKLYDAKKWRDAAAAYAKFAAGKAGGRDRCHALLRAALSKERLSDRKGALAGATRVINETPGHSFDDLVGEAFLLKQRLLFKSDAKTGTRQTLLKTAVSRVGWSAAVSRLHENEANRLLADGAADAAWRLYSLPRLVLSAQGTNVLAVMRCVYGKTGASAPDIPGAVARLETLHADNKPLARTLFTALRKNLSGDDFVNVTLADAELAAAEGDVAHARARYEDLLRANLPLDGRQRLRLRYAEWLGRVGDLKRRTAVYADWMAEVTDEHASEKGLKQCLSFLTGERRFREAQGLLARLPLTAARAYAARDLDALRKRLEDGAADGLDAGDDVNANARYERALKLMSEEKFSDAARLFRSAADKSGGDLRRNALTWLATALRKAGRARQACAVWDELGKDGDEYQQYEGLIRKAELLLSELTDVRAARETYAAAQAIARKQGGLNGDAAEEGLAVCDAIEGRTDDARTFFARKRDAAARLQRPDVLKWSALLDVCDAVTAAGGHGVSWIGDVVVADVLFAAERYAEAERLFARCLAGRTSPAELLAYVALQHARCLARMRRFAEALKQYGLFRTCFVKCRCAPDAALMAGVLCIGYLNDPDKGCDWLRFIDTTWPASPVAEQALFYRLTLGIWRGKWEEAAVLRADFLRRFPDAKTRRLVQDEYGDAIRQRKDTLGREAD